MKIVDKNLDIALHIQLYQIIKDMIESKELEEGASLMPERELCKLQNISRMTVNKAIINLVNEGLLERRQGKGTFVSYKKQQYRFQKLKGFTEVMSERGFNINNKILEFEIGTQNKIIREHLGIKNEHELIYKIDCQYKCNTLCLCYNEDLCRCFISKTLARSIIYYIYYNIKIILSYSRKIKSFRVKLS